MRGKTFPFLYDFSSAFNHCMALNSLLCADVPLRTYTHFCMTNSPRTICTKYYHKWSGFVDCISTKIAVCFFPVHSVYVCFVITIAVLIHIVLLYCNNLIKDTELLRCKSLRLSGNQSKISVTVDTE